MLNSAVTKRLHLTLTIILFLIIICWSIVPVLRFFCQSKETLYAQKQLSDDVYLYVTGYISIGSALGTCFYSYYLDKKIEGDPIEKLKRPFLITSEPKAEVSLIKMITPFRPSILVKHHGEILKFKNHDLWFGDTGEIFKPEITIEASSDGVS